VNQRADRTNPADVAENLARLLRGAFESGAALSHAASSPVPEGVDGAYRVQQRLLQLRGKRIGGWKVGAKSEAGPIQGAPLPSDGIQASPARLDRAAFGVVGLELEVAFRFGRAFAPSHRSYSSDEVLEGLASFCAAIEVVSSRFAGWPDIDPLLQLADLQNHGALAVGGLVDYDDDFPFLSPALRFRFDGDDIAIARPANPAGDPRRLLTWAVNHCTTRGLHFEEGTIVTTGSYTGVHFAQRSGSAQGEIAGLPAVCLELS
jgi:2-keto-4-pentenoate hydratase